MHAYEGLKRPIRLDPQGLQDAILRRGTPGRVFHMELFQDTEIRNAIAERFGLTEGLDRSDPRFEEKRYIAVQRFCGFDYVRVALDDVAWPLHKATIDDTASLERSGGRTYQDEHTGPIMKPEDLDSYPWPDLASPSVTRTLEWYQKNLPDDMCIVSGSASHFCELLTWFMGYETFCYALYDQRSLVKEISRRLLAIYRKVTELYLGFDRLKMVFASDDMGFRSGLLFSRADMIELVLEPHARISAMCHAAGRPYLLHTCGDMSSIMEYLVEEVKIDAKHSFEDTIEDVRDAKKTYGKRTGLIGGIDVDFLCRSNEKAIRKRVRDTLEVCQPGGGYCLGSGNSVTNYVPLESYLAMVDEGRLYSAS
jgi:uroporphyrinogen decarboxylase